VCGVLLRDGHRGERRARRGRQRRRRQRRGQPLHRRQGLLQAELVEHGGAQGPLVGRHERQGLQEGQRRALVGEGGGGGRVVGGLLGLRDPGATAARAHVRALALAADGGTEPLLWDEVFVEGSLQRQGFS